MKLRNEYVIGLCEHDLRGDLEKPYNCPGYRLLMRALLTENHNEAFEVLWGNTFGSLYDFENGYKSVWESIDASTGEQVNMMELTHEDIGREIKLIMIYDGPL